MSKRLAEDLIQSNKAYTKLRTDRLDGTAPREAPGGQATGTRGLRRPELEAWTTEELRRAAATLGAADAAWMRREELVEMLLSADLAAVSGRGRERRRGSS